MTVGNFSVPPADALSDALGKHYCGVHVEQGAPILDRDVNLLSDLLFAAMRQALQAHIGNGTAASGDFLVSAVADPLDFGISSGTYLADGLIVTLAANTTYMAQTPLPPALKPQSAGQPDPRTDLVCIEAWLADTDESTDPSLSNATDVGMRTSTRVVPHFAIVVFENAAAAPAPSPGHAYVAIATLTRKSSGGPPAVTDLRQTRLLVSDAAKRLAAIENAFQPRIDTIASAHVLPGQTDPIQITGRYLDLGDPIVMLGATPGLLQTPTSSTLLRVMVPANATPGSNLPLTVQTTFGLATAPVPLFIAAPAPPPVFVVKNGPTPQITPPDTTVEPPAKTALTLNGLHFTGVNRVIFNSPTLTAAVTAGADLTIVSDTLITVNAPDVLATAQGVSFTITVSNDAVVGAQATSDDTFRVDAPQLPKPTWGDTGKQIATSPVSTPVTQQRGKPIILTGTNFAAPGATTSVQFRGTTTTPAQPTDILSVTTTTIQVLVPMALTAPAPNNVYKIIVSVGATPSLLSNDVLIVTQ